MEVTMTRVKFCSTPTFEPLELIVNQALEEIETQGYGVKSIEYQAMHGMHNVLIIYGNGPTTVRSGPR